MIDLLGGKALVVLLTAAFAAIPPGPGYRVNVTADTNTPPPDGSGNFSAWGALNPSLDRRYVVFENITPPSIYTYDTATSKFYKIADLSTNFPGTATPFTSFFAGYNDPNSPIVAKGKVVFWGSNGTTNAIFSAPANSGPITKIVASGDAVPTGGNFTTIFRRLTTDGDSGVILNSGDIGVGYDDWYFPTISNGQVWVLAAVGASDPARAKSAIFTTSTPLVSDVYPYTGPARPATVYSSTNMPGNTNANFHTRYDAFALNNGTLAVIADDSFGKYAGVYFAVRDLAKPTRRSPVSSTTPPPPTSRSKAPSVSRTKTATSTSPFATWPKTIPSPSTPSSTAKRQCSSRKSAYPCSIAREKPFAPSPRVLA